MTPPLSRLNVIARYFRDPHQPLREFAEECKALTDADKLELAQGAARALGLSPAAVNFELPLD